MCARRVLLPLPPGLLLGVNLVPRLRLRRLRPVNRAVASPAVGPPRSGLRAVAGKL